MVRKFQQLMDQGSLCVFFFSHLPEELNLGSTIQPCSKIKGIVLVYFRANIPSPHFSGSNC